MGHTEVPSHKQLSQTSLSHGLLQKLAQKEKTKLSMAIKDSDLKVEDETENKWQAGTGASSLSYPYSEIHANIESLQVANLAVSFILRRFWRGSNTVRAIPPNPLPTVTTQTQILRLTKTIAAKENGTTARICLSTLLLFTKLEANSGASI